MLKSGKKFLNLEKTLGLSNATIHHGWQLFMMGLVVTLYIYYFTPYLGGYHNQGRGLLTIPAIMFTEVPCAVLYGISLWSNFDYVYLLNFLYKVILCNMAVAVICQILDTVLFLAAHESYCKLQLEYHHS